MELNIKGRTAFLLSASLLFLAFPPFHFLLPSFVALIPVTAWILGRDGFWSLILGIDSPLDSNHSLGNLCMECACVCDIGVNFGPSEGHFRLDTPLFSS